MAIVEISKVSKSFNYRKVLEDISMSLDEGTFCTLLGENGAGKSTLLGLLIGNEAPEEGNIKIFNQPIKMGLGKLKENIGYVSEGVQFNVPDSMEDFFKAYSKLYPKWDQVYFEELKDYQGTSLNLKFNEYSRGQKMQLALIAALSIRPKLLLIDEVTSVLDIYAQRFFLEKIKEFSRKGGVVILTTNILSEIEGLADVVYLLEKGKLKDKILKADLEENYIKILRPETLQHSLFEHPECHEIYQNDKKDSIFFMKRELWEQNKVDGATLLEKVGVQDFFLYSSKSKDRGKS